MRGSPLIRALVAFLAILALGYPLRRLTGEAVSTRTVAATPAPSTTRAVELQVTFTTAPKSFSVRHLGKEIWSGAPGQMTAERKVALSYPPEGIELQFVADFPDGAPLAAARLVLTDPDGDRHEKSVWGTGAIDEVVAFP